MLRICSMTMLSANKMEKTKRKHDDIPIQVFKPGRGSQLIVVAIIIFSLLHFFYWSREFEAGDILSIVYLIFFIGFYGFVLLNMILSATQKIVIYEDGIEQQYGSRRTFAKWEDLSYIQQRKRGKSRVTGIVTAVPMQNRVSGGLLEKYLHHKWDMQFLELTAISKMPVISAYIDSSKLRDTKFGQILFDYAPHLFGEERKEKSYET